MDNCLDFDPLEYSSYQPISKPPSTMSSSIFKLVENLVNDNKIVIFSKTSCPYCDDSKSLLAEMGVNYKAVELDKMKEGKLVQNTLGHITDAQTVPRIFINGQCVGGNSDLKSLSRTGVLKQILQDVSDSSESESSSLYSQNRR